MHPGAALGDLDHGVRHRLRRPHRLEILEYLLLEGVGAVELDLSLRDTLTDQAWGLLGAVVGATLPLLGPAPSAEREGSPEQD